MVKWLTYFFFIGAFTCVGAALSLWIGIRFGNPEGWFLDVGQGAVIGGLAGWMIHGGVNRPGWWPSVAAGESLRDGKDGKGR